ncbi:MAG: AAA family ATPase [Candidatus Heimdallarchaeaceae archaeon]
MTIDDSESSSKFVFNKLIIRNFKMHKYTELDLMEKPLIVISGANGSGKSQILETLILVIGHTPTRVALGKKEELIGSFGESAIIQLFISNPLLGERRLFQSSDLDIESFVNNKDSFIVELEIRKNQSIRKIKSLDGNEKIVTKRQIQALMKQIGIFEDTMLNFTEEGYLNAFAEGSPHKKLETLLVATGLNEIYQSYFDSKKKLSQMQREHSPLVMQLEKEKTKLQQMEEDYDLIAKKNNLIKRLEMVTRELVWCDFEEADRVFQNHLREIEKVKNKIESYQKEEIKLQQEKESILVQFNEIEKEKEQLNKLVDSLRSTSTYKKGMLEEKERLIQSKYNRIYEIEEREKKIDLFSSEEGLKTKQKLHDKLNEIKTELDHIDTRISEIVSTIQSLEKEKEKTQNIINERSFFLGNLKQEERRRLDNCKLFRDKVDQSKYANEIIGPIYQVISIKKGFEKYEKAIKTAISYSLFDFVAISYEAYEEAKKIFDQIRFSQNRSVKLTVGRVLEQEGPKPDYYKKKLEITSNRTGIIDYAVNLIDAPYQVLEYLKKFRKTIIADSTVSANLLTDYAKQYKSNILTTDCKSYYLSREAFSNPPPVLGVKLGSDIKSYKSTEVLRAKISQIEVKKEQLLREKFSLNSKSGELLSKKREIDNDLFLFARKSDVSTELTNLFMEKEKLEEEIRQEEELIKKIHEELNEFDDKLNSALEKIDKLSKVYFSTRKQLDNLEREIEQYKKTRENLLTTLNKLNAEVPNLQVRIDELKKQIEEIGDRPETIREERETISSEVHEIKGQLSYIQVQGNISAEAINAQRIRVERLQELIEKGNKHLENLKVDIEKRLNQWTSALQKIVDHLNGSLKNLLSEVFEEISISISNYKNEKEASLIISAKTKNKNLNYRQLSGGEKTLIAQAIILSLHLISYSPLHVIDEFTQKLDKKNRTYAFSVAYSVYLLAKQNRSIVPQFILISPGIEDVKLNEDFNHNVLIETKVCR